jgi:hypothetical protein
MSLGSSTLLCTTVTVVKPSCKHTRPHSFVQSLIHTRARNPHTVCGAAANLFTAMLTQAHTHTRSLGPFCHVSLNYRTARTDAIVRGFGYKLILRQYACGHIGLQDTTMPILDWWTLEQVPTTPIYAVMPLGYGTGMMRTRAQCPGGSGWSLGGATRALTTVHHDRPLRWAFVGTVKGDRDDAFNAFSGIEPNVVAQASKTGVAFLYVPRLVINSNRPMRPSDTVTRRFSLEPYVGGLYNWHMSSNYTTNTTCSALDSLPVTRRGVHHSQILLGLLTRN